MKKVFAVRGKGNSGKTTSILMAYKKILKKYSGAKIIFYKEYLKEITAVIDIGGIVIGFETQGDPNSRLNASLKLFLNKHECDIIICATRSYGQTVKYVEDVEKYGYEITWIIKEQDIESKIYEGNNSTANTIVKNIEIMHCAV
jgi:UDP-glucose 6-dehydrogenase